MEEIIIYRHGKTGESGSSQVNRVEGQKWVILSGLNTGLGNRVVGQVGLTCIFHMNFFS